MRSRRSNDNITLNVISGTHVVLLGMDATEEAKVGLLGFAIQRTDHTENEEYWLKGFKTFKETEGQAKAGKEVSSFDHPIQAFLWGDYTAKPNHKYTYKLVPLYGKPGDVTKGDSIGVTISTENEDMGTHAVYFNRGVAGSQAYAKKFGTGKPQTKEAYQWLSRGLQEAMLTFIGKADGKEYSIRASVYEFSYMPVLEAFKKASETGADIKIVYDHRKENPYITSDKKIKEAGIEDLMIKRQQNHNDISHNKFMVLLKNGIPVEVWTGSTNYTEGGIFGQSNVGHIVRDLKTAKTYYEYWGKIATDPEMNDFRRWNIEHTPIPDIKYKKNSLDVIFSPRESQAKSSAEEPYAMDWYAERLEEARMMVNFTAAFGVNKELAEVFKDEKEYLRYLILDNPGSVASSKQITTDIIANKDNRVAIGAYLNSKNTPHGMVEEHLTNMNNHVKYLHTKYMILDALSNEPTLISGSANFSDNSTKNNDENMLVIKGNTRVADIYLGEFMRLFNHFYFRDIYNRLEKDPESDDYNSAYLHSDNSWSDKYYVENSIHWKERLRFRGSEDNGYGVTFFDIDETLFHTSSKVLVKSHGKVVKELSNQEFNTYVLKDNEVFDFTQFRDAELFKDTSKPIVPVVNKIKDMTSEALRNGDKIALLTARQSFHDMATFMQAFVDQGIQIDKIDINFAGDVAEEAGSIAKAKKQIVMKYLEHGEYDRAVLLDDNIENLQEFISTKEIYSNVEFTAIHIDNDGKSLITEIESSRLKPAY